MFKITFSEDSQVFVCIAKDLKLEEAIQFALNLHRSSNTKHSVYVEDECGNVHLVLSSVSS